MPKFSLIIPTVGRTSELAQLLASFSLQSYSNYEVIVIDQNEDDRLDTIIQDWLQNTPADSRPVRLVHKRCKRGVSRARNLGLQNAEGEIISFPDDDCWYVPGTLRNIDRWFAENDRYHILSVTAKDEQGVRSGNRWVADHCDLAGVNIFRTTFTSAFFVRRTGGDWVLHFDETIGPGGVYSRFGSGEDTDFILQLMRQGMKGRFNAAWHIGHPRRDMLSGTVTKGRAGAYGEGMGYVLRKHSMHLLGGALVMYDMVRAGLVLLRGRREAASLSLAHGRGIVSGYLAASRNQKKSKLEVRMSVN